MNDIKKTRVTSDGKIKISVNIPEKTLKKLDELRKLNKQTRSSWITMSILERIAKYEKETP